jgi:hypothetical protein
MSFMLYVLGFLLVTAGVAWGMVRLGVATVYVAIVSIILMGMGIVRAVSRTRSKDPPKG